MGFPGAMCSPHTHRGYPAAAQPGAGAQDAGLPLTKGRAPGRRHSRARVAPKGVQENLPVVHHHHVPQRDQGGLRAADTGSSRVWGAGRGGLPGAGGEGLTAKSSKLLAQYSSCS